MYTPQRLVLDMKVVDYLKQIYLTENPFDYITTKSGVHDDIDLLKLKKTLQIYQSVFVILIKKIMSSIFLNYIINIVSIVITEILSFTWSIMFCRHVLKRFVQCVSIYTLVNAGFQSLDQQFVL